MSFTEKVLEVVKKIPRGRVLSYKQVAKLAGKPKAWRAVGNILNKSAIGRKKVPCHRVIKSNGEIGGYRDGFKKKREKLKKEGVYFKKIKNRLKLKNGQKTTYSTN